MFSSASVTYLGGFRPVLQMQVGSGQRASMTPVVSRWIFLGR